MITPQVTQTEEEVTNVQESLPRKVVKTTTKIDPPPLAQDPPQKVYNTKKTIFRTYQILWYVLGILEILLTFRMILKLVGANPAIGFTNFIYSISDPFARPFFGVVASSVSGNSIVEWSTLFAMAVYWVIVWGIIEFFQLVKPVDRQEVEQTLDNQ